MVCKSIAIGIAVFCSALAVRAAEQTTITINKPVDANEGFKVAKRLGEINFGSEKCGFLRDERIAKLLLTKVLESDSQMFLETGQDELTKRSETFGMAAVCESVWTMFGTDGSVIKGALNKIPSSAP